MSDDKKIIFSMVNVIKNTPQGKQIIKDIHLSFYYGAKIGILGLNGAGKSTVMKIIAGIDKTFKVMSFSLQGTQLATFLRSLNLMKLKQ